MRDCAFLLLLALLLPAAVAGAGENKIFPYDTHVETLDNGLEVIVIPMSSGGLVAYWSVVRTGARDEVEPGRTGFAHFFEHMMFRGTEKYPAEAYNNLVTKIGADSNAYTTDDYTAYHMSFAAEDLETVVELESDRFRNLSYPEEMFRTESGAVYGEYRKGRTSPYYVLYEAALKTAFEKHTYGHMTIGYEADIQAMPTLFEYSRSFFSRYYRPDNVVLMIVGDVEVAPTMELVRRYYSGWEPGYEAPQVPVEPPQTAERRIAVDYEGHTLPIVSLFYKAEAFDPANVDLAAADLLCALAFGETSEVYQQLVLEQQTVEGIETDLPIQRDPGLIEITTVVKDPAKIDAVVAELDRVIARFKAEPPAAERVADLKSRLKYQFLMSLDTPSNVADALARVVAVTGGVEAVDRLFATYDRITPQDVQQAAQKYLRDERRTVVVLRGEG